MTKKKTPKAPPSPWEHCHWEPADASAIQAVAAGIANESQQKRALDFIITNICAIDFLAFDPSSQRHTDFALGKQAVGHRIAMLMRVKIGSFTEEAGAK